ncbi:CbbBc protein [Pandoraea horticolens]|uniref:CbbBc protein n=1 Tax=Pandoraea horticolens TaxID=2508298 RepID=A0A5E4XGZ0_9BURK|nr:FdhF/YdeP family oxidoreductase [Pandoraea horticolens]VVE35547.1 CbbBc protein [Pandoraea horticolens]
MSAPKIAPYDRPAGGWGALKNVAIQLVTQGIPLKGARTLLSANQPSGFDCPGCAWPDREHASTFEFCENGVKAVAAEATKRRVTPAFFAEHSVTGLLTLDDYTLEGYGRLTHPMRYDAATDHYMPIAWDDAFALIGEHLRALPDADQAAFYTSGRTSNEAAFLYQLFVRQYGTNNFPDCSNMCHEPTSVGLPPVVGLGKGTVTLEDFELADTLLLFGQNPGTNHPRMLGELREAARRGATIVSVNLLHERGLERFVDPQSPAEMLSMGGTAISGHYVTPASGGDFAFVKGVIKHVLERDSEARAIGEPPLLDDAFIAEHTHGFENFAADVQAERWDDLERASGVSQAQMCQIADVYLRGERVIATWGMGITQHKQAVATIQMIVNLMLLRGNIGRPGAGLCPVRGHSNVQGDRTVGINEKPSAAFLDRLGKVFDFAPPQREGLGVVDTISAMLDGRIKVFIGMGGNFAMATPDTPRTWEGLRQCDLTVHVATKLNRSHLVHGRDALILPCLGRTEVDMQNGTVQGVTVEDSMSMVHLSYGINAPASEHLRSEPAIVAGMAQATMGRALAGHDDWHWYVQDYDRIRDAIAATFDDFADFNRRVRHPGGFRLAVPPSERRWLTANARANFTTHALPHELPIDVARRQAGERGADVLQLATIRSHDQYNTTIYGLNDRYRGVFGQRRVVFANIEDLDARGLRAGERVDVVGVWNDGIARRADDFLLVAYDIPRGCIAAYYPETNGLVPLDAVADGAGTPTSKSIPVLLERRHGG